MSLFSLDKINGLFNIAELKTGVGFGGELFYRISPKLSLLFHVETISKAVQVEVTSITPSEIYDLKASSMPVMVGVDYSMMDQDSIRADFGVLAGLGLSTKFNSQASGATAPNITTYSGSPLTFMARFLAEYQLTRKFGIGGYAGYRILKLSQAAPTTVGKTYSDDPLLDATGAFTPQEVNLSGPILGLSTTFRF